MTSSRRKLRSQHIQPTSHTLSAHTTRSTYDHTRHTHPVPTLHAQRPPFGSVQTVRKGQARNKRPSTSPPSFPHLLPLVYLARPHLCPSLHTLTTTKRRPSTTNLDQICSSKPKSPFPTSTHSPHLLSTLYIPITSSSHAATRQCCVDPGAAQVLVGSVWSGLWKRCLTVGARRERKQQRETTQLSAADTTTRQRQCGGCCWFVGLLHSGQVVGKVWWRV